MEKMNPGMTMKFYRVERWLYTHGFKRCSQMMYRVIFILFNCAIPATTVLEKGVIMPHGIGIVIHQWATVGENTTIYQHVTIGSAHGPKIGKNCIIGSGACILGDIVIGDNCKIGANAVVMENIPDNSTAVGVPAKIIEKNKKRDFHGFQ